MRAAVVLAWPTRCEPAQAVELLARARWISFVDTSGTPKLMRAAPDDMHPVFVFLECDRRSGQLRITVDAEAVEAGRRLPLTLRVGEFALYRDARGETESPTGPYREIELPIRHPFWDALAGGPRLLVQSPALARPVALGLRTLPGPLSAFRRACEAQGAPSP